MNLSRRGFIGGAVAILSAPAIVRASSLMPVKSRISHAGFEFSGFYSQIPVGQINRRMMENLIIKITEESGGQAPDFIYMPEEAWKILESDFVVPSPKITVLGIPIIKDA